MRGLTGDFAVDLWIDRGHSCPLVTFQNNQLLHGVAHNDEMMTPWIDEVSESIGGAVVEEPGHVRTFRVFREFDLHQIALQRVVKQPLVLERVGHQDVRLRLRLHVPLASPLVRFRVFREETDLAEGGSQDDTVPEPRDHRKLYVRADAASLGVHDAIDVAAVEVAEEDVALRVSDRQQRLRARSAPVHPHDPNVFRKLHLVI